MQPAVGNQQPHGIPGTPVGDLFPLGNALLGDGNRSSIRPIRAGKPVAIPQVMSPTLPTAREA